MGKCCYVRLIVINCLVVKHYWLVVTCMGEHSGMNFHFWLILVVRLVQVLLMDHAISYCWVFWSKLNLLWGFLYHLMFWCCERELFWVLTSYKCFYIFASTLDKSGDVSFGLLPIGTWLCENQWSLWSFWHWWLKQE